LVGAYWRLHALRLLQAPLPWPPKKEDLERLYVEEKLSAAKIAKAYGLRYKSDKTAESTVLYHLKRFGIRRRGRAEHLQRVTPEIEDVWARRYAAGESLKRIAAGEYDPVTVWNHLKKRGVRLRDKVEAQIKAVTKHERHSFDGNQDEKSYLIGLRYGDLHVILHGRAVRVRVSTTHPAMARLFKSLFSPYAYVHEYPRQDMLTGHEWSLECDLDGSFEFLLRRPDMAALSRMPDSQFKAFLAGFFDAEGSIYLHRKSNSFAPEVDIKNTDYGLLRLVAKKLARSQGGNKIGILGTGPKSVWVPCERKDMETSDLAF
jgi:LAGLIDADG-like domain